jgi:hypothetical protein
MTKFGSNGKLMTITPTTTINTGHLKEGNYYQIKQKAKKSCFPDCTEVGYIYRAVGDEYLNAGDVAICVNMGECCDVGDWSIEFKETRSFTKMLKQLYYWILLKIKRLEA